MSKFKLDLEGMAKGEVYEDIEAVRLVQEYLTEALDEFDSVFVLA